MSSGEGSALSKLVFVVGTRLPFLANLPAQRNRAMVNLRRTMSVIADELLERMRREKNSHVTDETADRSVIGLLRKSHRRISEPLAEGELVKAEEEDAELHMNESEVVAQVRSFCDFQLGALNIF